MSAPDDELSAAARELSVVSRIAIEMATESLAKQLDAFAADPLMESVTGTVALRAFAASIRRTNAKVWPAEGSPS